MQQTGNSLEDLMGLANQTSMSDQLYEKISKLILDGTLEEGYVFPNEAVLCDQLKVGRSTLREAYKALELSGYITRSKRGTRVNSRLEILNNTSLKSVFHSATRKEFTQFRLMVEQKSAYYAAERATLTDVEKLKAMLLRMEETRSLGNFEELMELDEQFHIKIANLSGNSLIVAIINVMAEEWKQGILHNFQAAIKNNLKVFDLMLEQHREIVAAIQDRDSRLASDLMKTHIESVTVKEE